MASVQQRKNVATALTPLKQDAAQDPPGQGPRQIPITAKTTSSTTTSTDNSNSNSNSNSDPVKVSASDIIIKSNSSKLGPNDRNRRRRQKKSVQLWSVAFTIVVALMIFTVLFVTHSITKLSSSSSSKKNEQENFPTSKSSRTGEQQRRQEQQEQQQQEQQSNPKYHIIFSTGCTLIQDWQSYMFFYHALRSKQPGTVTRIASGCSNEDQVKLAKLFDEQIASMTTTHSDTDTDTDTDQHDVQQNFRIHFTPDYSYLKKDIFYKYFNKPYGTKHWLEHALGFPNKVTPEDENSIVILMDPDQIIIRPFANNYFPSNTTEWWGDGKGDGNGDPSNTPLRRTSVQHGQPMGQRYGFGTQWMHAINLERLLRDSDSTRSNDTSSSSTTSATTDEKNSLRSSPISQLGREEADSGYVVGPPYIATARDMYQIATKWSEFVVPVHDQYSDLLAEMFAYCLAAAHLRLPHQTAVNFMVSEVTTSSHDEGWSFIDTLPDTDLCLPQDPMKLPYVFHYCQRYGLGTWMFGKFRLPNDFLSCPHPLLKDPPLDIARLYNYTDWPDGSADKWKSFVHVRRNAFGMCFMIQAANAAATYYKQRHCKDTTNDPPNYEKTLTFP